MDLSLLQAPGEMAERVRRFDWAGTSLGPIESWPRSLISYVSMILQLPTPAIIFWGEQQTQIYNDGYAVIMGPRHPAFFAAPYRECWPDTYPVIDPWMRRVLDRGETVRVDRALIPVSRYGFDEDAYFTFTFSPLRDDTGRIAGIYQPVNEVTEAVLGERRGETLRALASPAVSVDPIDDAVAALARNASDIPFAAIFERSEHGDRLEVVGQTGTPGDHASLALLAANADAPERAGSSYVVPLRRSDGDARAGVVAFGVNPRLHFDDKYKTFLEVAASQLATIVTKRRQVREEQRQAQAVAELERSRRADAQRERQRLYATLMNAPTLFCIVTGDDLVIELANHACLRSWGKDERIVGMPLIAALPELANQPFPGLLRDVLRTGVACRQNAALARVDKAGDGVFVDTYYDFSYEPLRDEAGAVVSVFVFAADVTRQVVAQRAIEGALDEARRANRAKDEFLAMLSHELRNPMAPIVTALELMKLRSDRDVTRERQVIERQTKHLVRMLDDLLDVARIVRGAFDVARTPHRLADLVARSVETASPLLESKQHRIEVAVPPHIIVDVDPNRMNQVFSNLLMNAAKYTPNGGHIEVAARDAGDHVAIVVRDNGIGIAPDMLPRMFEMFVQDRQDIDRAQGGLGLGLAIVRAIVRRHGGDVAARSTGRGQGSELEVRLPLPDAARLASPQVADRAPGVRAGSTSGRVLIVDDNIDAASLLADAVQAMGHEACVAHDGSSALTVAATFQPDVALLDIGLPVMDGYELARLLRSRGAIRLVAVTGYGRDGDREQSKRAGFDVHMVKPVDITRLAATIEQLITSR